MTTGSGYIYGTLPSSTRMKNRCQIAARIDDALYEEVLGDNSGVTMSRIIEESEVYSGETPDKDLAVLDTTKNDISLTLNLRQLSAFARTILFQSNEEIVTQAAAPGQTKTFPDVRAGVLLNLGAMNLQDVVVTGGANDTPYTTENVKIDAEGGRIHILSHPAGVVLVAGVAEITVEFDVPELKIPTYGVSARTNIRGSLIIRQNNKWGDTYEMEFWDVQFRPDGDLPLGAEADDFLELVVTCRVFADPTKPAAYRLGRARTIKRAA